MSEVKLYPRTDDPALIKTIERYLREAGATNVKHMVAEIAPTFYTVTQTREPVNLPGTIPDFRWHLSVAGPDDVPPWNAMAAIAHAVRPGVAFCIPMPPRSQWMNYNERVLHLYEVKDYNLTEQWRREGKGHTPT